MLKRVAKSALYFIHSIGMRAGVVILPKHYYVPISDINELRRTRQHWAKRSAMLGVDINITNQIKFLEKIKLYEPEYRGNKTFLQGQAQHFGPGFGYIEAQALHGFLRATKPRKIVEVGSGVSTYCAQIAAQINDNEANLKTQITCIEPYPSSYLQKSNQIRLVQAQVERIPLHIFDELNDGDFLFIDSTHTVKAVGDVLYLYLEVIPRLKPGVMIHIHDIYFPYLYQRDILSSLFQWQETSLLQALLVNNNKIEIFLCLSLLHYDAPEALAQVFPEYQRQPDNHGLADNPDPNTHFPSSIYLRTK
jgi:hypothetical protein